MSIDDVASIGKKGKKKAVSFTIDEKVLEEFKKAVDNNNAKQSPVIEEFMRFYVEKSKSLI